MSTWMIVPSEEDIEHSHKYIEKVRTASGKWRYIYTRGKRRLENKIGINQKERLDQAKRETRIAQRHQEGVKHELDKNRGYINASKRILEMDPNDDMARRDLENSKYKEGANMAWNSDANKRVQNAKRSEKAAQASYDKTVMGKLDSAIGAVKDYGKKAFDSVMNLFKPNKKSVTNKNSGTGYGKSQYTPGYNTKKRR